MCPVRDIPPVTLPVAHLPADEPPGPSFCWGREVTEPLASVTFNLGKKPEFNFKALYNL